MKIKDPTNFAAGLLFILLGSGAALIALRYQMGTPSRMGPGYFPFALGTILCLLGGLSILRSLGKGGERVEPETWNLSVLARVILPVVVFAILLRPLGFVLTLVVVVIASTTASHEFSWRYAVGTAVFLTLLCYVIFHSVIGLQLPLWPMFVV